MNKLVMLFLGMCIASAPGTAYTAGDFIQIKGSDTMVNLSQAWAEAFNAAHPHINIAVTGGGSGTGINSLISRTCHIAQCSRLIEPREAEKAHSSGVDPVSFMVGLDGIAIIVHPDNPVKNLTLDQLRDIFIRNVRNWKELGGEDKQIVILSREVNSGTHLFFKEQVLRRGDANGKEEFSPYALLMPSSQAIADEVR